MSHPAERYIKFLMTSYWVPDVSKHLNLDMANVFFEGLGMPVVLPAQFRYIAQNFIPPDPFFFSNKKHPATLKFMRAEELADLWIPTDDVRRMISTVIRPSQTRDFVDLLLIGHIPPIDVIDWVNRRFNVQYTEEMLQAYAYYFFDVGLAGEQEWNEILAKHPRRSSMMAAYRCGPEQALFRAGVNPKIEDPKKALREAYRQVVFRLSALRYEDDNKITLERQSRLIHDLKTVYDLLFSAEGGSTDETLQKFRQFLLVTQPAKVKAFDEIVGQGGTISGMDNTRKVTGDQNDEPSNN